MEGETDYDFASFDGASDLYQRRSSSASSGAYSCFKQPSCFSVTQLTDLYSLSSKNTSTHSKKSTNNGKGKNESNTLRSGAEPTATSALPAPPTQVSAATTTTATTTVPTAFILRSRPASGISLGGGDADDSFARLGRNFLAPDGRSHLSSTTVLSPVSSRRSMTTTAAAGSANSVKPASPIDSERALYTMPNIYPSFNKPFQHVTPQPQSVDRKQAAASTESNPQLPGVPPHSPMAHRHRNSAPVMKSNHALQQQQHNSGRVSNARFFGRDGRSGTGSTHAAIRTAPAETTTAMTNNNNIAKTTTPLTVSRPTDPRKPAEAAAQRSRPRMNAAPAAAHHKSSSSSRSGDEDSAMTRAVSLDKEFGRVNGSEPKIYFYNIAHTTSPSGSSLKGENVVPIGPIIRTAKIQWDDDSDTESSPPALAYVSRAAAAASVEEEDHVQIIIVTADAEVGEPPAEVRPPPLDARQNYVSTPLLCPLAAPPDSAFESSRSAWHASFSGNDAGDNFKADEVVDVDYASGSAVRKSLIADALRIHFLSGHNTMLTIANTPQCTALAEDAVSTMIQAVYQQSELMGSDFRNELSICAHAVYPEGGVYNLLPTTTETQSKTELRIGANPVMGTRIVSNAPVNIWSMGEATFLSRALVQNARHLSADPYADPNVVVHITVLLRQTRSSTRPEPDLEVKESTPRSACSPQSSSAVSVEVSPLDMHVYLSSLQILWVGHNYPVVHHLLTDQPAHLWPLYRQAFGGQCCTAVMSFVDRQDDLVYSKSTLEFSQYMRKFVNRPPRSGSVQKFLISTEQAANEELDRNILSLEKMRRDAMKLLKDPAAEPCLYAVTPHNELNQQPYIGAYRVMLIPSGTPTPKKETTTNNSKGSSWFRSAQLTSTPSSAHGRQQLSPSDRSSVAEIQIHMPSYIKRQEKSSWNVGGKPVQLQSPQMASQTQLPPASSPPPPPPPSSTAAAALLSETTHHTQSKDAHAHSNRGTSPDSTGPNVLNTHNNNNINGNTNNSSTALNNDEPISTDSSYGECIKTNVLVVRGVLEAHDYAASASSSRHDTPLSPEMVTSRLPLKIQDSHTLVLAAPQDTGKGKPVDESLRFEVDEVHEANFDHSTNNYRLLHNFEALQDVYHAFVEDETNVAVLCTHCSGTVRPFQRIPVWEVVEGIMSSVSDAQMRLPTPSQFTLFGSTLKGNTILRDLAEVGSHELDRPVDGQEALVGASPLFGSILYQTRGVDLFDVSEVRPVLHSMLKYADDEAGADPEVYLVMTAVRKTTRQLPPSEAPDHQPEYAWDASFSSCTVVVTRNTMDFYQNAVVEMNAVVGPNKPVFPFGLLSEVIGGSCKTVHFLSMETANTPNAVAARAFDAQHMLGQVQNEAQRSSRISVYVSACLTASRAIYAALDNLKQLVASGNEAARDITSEDELMARDHAAKLEALAEQHAEYLRNCDIRGFVIYPTLTVEDMQTLFFTSFRYGNSASSGKLKQLQATYSNTHTSSVYRHRSSNAAEAAAPSPSQRPQQPSQQQQQQQQQYEHSSTNSEVVAVDPEDSLPASEKNATGGGAPAVSKAQPVSAVALSRDSGIVAHTMLLLYHTNEQEQQRNHNSSNSTCCVSHSPTNEVTVNYGTTESVYAFDDIVQVTCAVDATHVSPTRNYAAFHASVLLHDAVAGCLAGYNSTMIFQETTHAQDRGVCESLCQHVCRSCVASCPPEAAFFLSVGYLDEHSAVDLLDPKAVAVATRVSGVEGRSTPLLGKSPFTGTFLANAKLTLVRGSRDVAEALSAAFHGDDAVTEGGAPPHFVVISLWQKLQVSGEQDVCISSILIILTRGGMRLLQTSLSRASSSAIVQLLTYALRGSCYTICGCAITDTEPRAATSGDPHDLDLEPAMNFYQNNLNAYTGKALRYNSVTDAIKSHRNELARVRERWAAYQQKVKQSAAAGAPGISEQEKKDGDATEFAMRHLQRMIKDEEGLLRQDINSLTAVPPFYIVNEGH